MLDEMRVSENKIIGGSAIVPDDIVVKVRSSNLDFPLDFKPRYQASKDSSSVLDIAYFEERHLLKAEGVSGIGYAKGMRIMISDRPLFEVIEQQKAVIEDLNARLKEFERAHRSLPSKPHLPKGYFEDLIE